MEPNTIANPTSNALQVMLGLSILIPSSTQQCLNISKEKKKSEPVSNRNQVRISPVKWSIANKTSQPKVFANKLRFLW